MHSIGRLHQINNNPVQYHEENKLPQRTPADVERDAIEWRAKSKDAMARRLAKNGRVGVKHE